MKLLFIAILFYCTIAIVWCFANALEWSLEKKYPNSGKSKAPHYARMCLMSPVWIVPATIIVLDGFKRMRIDADK